MSKNRVRVWFKQFKEENRNSVSDDPRPGRKRTARTRPNVDAVHRCLHPDWRKTVRMIAEEVSLSKTSVHKILKDDLNLSKVAPKLVPKLLTQEQVACRCNFTRENLALLKDDPELIFHVVTGDESWVSIKELETKSCSLEWTPKGMPAMRPMKVRRQRSVRKLMLTVFFDWQGLILIDFLPPGDTVDTDRYLEVLSTLKERIRRKRPDLWRKPNPDSPRRNFVIHHDNASSHTSAPTLAFFEDIDLLAHPPYSPDLAPCDYFLFPRLKSQLATLQIRNLEELKHAVHRELNKIPSEDFCAAIRQMPLRWMKVQEANGSYFEGRHLSVDPAEYGLEDLFKPPEEVEDSSDSDSD